MLEIFLVCLYLFAGFINLVGFEIYIKANPNHRIQDYDLPLLRGLMLFVWPMFAMWYISRITIWLAQKVAFSLIDIVEDKIK